MAQSARPLSIGKLQCANNLVLAPMAGITDSPFRRLCLRCGAGLVVGEMVSARALAYGNAKTRKMLKLNPGEHPAAIQIFGGDAASIAIAAAQAAESGADIIDINAGCPVKKVLRSGSGSALMKDERAFAAVIAAAVKAVPLPVTVKIRTGLEPKVLLSPKLAKIAENEGAAAVTVHARPACAFHSGPPDMEGLAKTCAFVKIPVIGNGGVASAGDALNILNAGCSAVMIGRAAAGNPGLFRDINDFMLGKTPRPLSFSEKAALFLELLKDNAAYYGANTALLRCRKVAGFWLKGFKNSSALRTRFVTAKTLEEACSLLQNASTSIC